MQYKKKFFKHILFFGNYPAAFGGKKRMKSKKSWQVSYRGLQKSSSELKESCIIEKKSSICNNTKSTTQKNWLQWLMR